MLKNIVCAQRALVRHCLRSTPKKIQIRTIGCISYGSKLLCNLPKNNRVYSADVAPGPSLDPLKYEQVCEETLESLCEYFDELVENCSHLKGSDVFYGDGVLTVKFGEPYGTYVINRQSPNKQIWLSSPTSGPKRYDFVPDGDGYWVYKHDGVPLHHLLQKEISRIVGKETQFEMCSHSFVLLD